MTAIEQIPLQTIDGEPTSLGAYSGKVRLVVNVASQCGFTPQYTGLEALYRRYRERGFEVLGFPANEFGAQEPGSDAAIKNFCSTKYEVSFPIFSKIVVKGAGQHPLYQGLTQAKPEVTYPEGSQFRAKMVGYGIDLGQPGEIMWNFEKFLVDREGRVVQHFSPDTEPNDPQLASAIEKSL